MFTVIAGGLAVFSTRNALRAYAVAYHLQTLHPDWVLEVRS